ncbi:MAG: patatin-like phospholipase family protein [Candidatus Thiodiazotropha sp.]
MIDMLRDRPHGELSIIMSFSGGGTRASALAYGVLLELRDTIVSVNGKDRRLLDFVNIISSVSGGSFTAAYYGLYGDKIFTDFEEKFLRADVEASLMHGLLDPTRWLSGKERTDMAVEYYQERLFGNATFADMHRKNAPVVLINASDLSTGSRISFVQEFFNLICSDIGSFPVAKAVTASSAVPLLFNPVVVENHQGCDTGEFKQILSQVKDKHTDSQVKLAAKDLEKLVSDKLKYRYLHLVDGGITDNLGLRSFFEITELSGGIKPFMDRIGYRKVSNSVVIVVDASTDTAHNMAERSEEPTFEQVINAMSDIQLHRYNASTLELMQDSIQRWHAELSSQGWPSKLHFIEVGFKSSFAEDRQEYFNRIPTSFKLTNLQVNALIDAGRESLRNNPVFQRLVQSLHSTPF